VDASASTVNISYFAADKITAEEKARSEGLNALANSPFLLLPEHIIIRVNNSFASCMQSRVYLCLYSLSVLTCSRFSVCYPLGTSVVSVASVGSGESYQRTNGSGRIV
jgi:hypothetical protein